MIAPYFDGLVPAGGARNPRAGSKSRTELLWTSSLLFKLSRERNGLFSSAIAGTERYSPRNIDYNILCGIWEGAYVLGRVCVLSSAQCPIELRRLRTQVTCDRVQVVSSSLLDSFQIQRYPKGAGGNTSLYEFVCRHARRLREGIGQSIKYGSDLE